MLYKRYFEQTQKLAAFLGQLYRFRVLIITVLSLITLTSVSLTAAKGVIVMDDGCPREIVYGESLPYKASAFLSDVSYEYLRDGDAEWTTTPPVTVGSYYVRAVGISSFDNPRYGDEHPYAIVPRPITAIVADTQFLYGDTPAVRAELLYDHVLSAGVILGNLADAGSPTAMVDRETVRITDAAGHDMTANYAVNETPIIDVTLLSRDVRVTVEDREKIFDDLALSFDGFEVAAGTLAAGDRMVAMVDDTITDVGTVENTPVLHVYTADGVDVSRYYALELVPGKLTVTARPLYITTADSTVEYDGTVHTCHDYSVHADSAPVEGHTLRVLSDTSASALHVGKIPNRLDLRIYDAAGVEETANYNLFLEPGTLTVTPRPVTVITGSGTFEYDGAYHRVTELADGYAAAGDTLWVDPAAATAVRDVAEGVQDNHLVVTFLRDGQDVTANYAITYQTGTLTVTPRPVAAVTDDLTVIYDAELHAAPGCTLTYTGKAPDTTVALCPGDSAAPLPDTLTTVRDVVDGLPNRYTLAFTRTENGLATDISDNYQVTYTLGTLSVTPRPICVQVSDVAKVYDDAPLTSRAAEALLLSDAEGAPEALSLPAGHTIVLTTEGAQTDVGTSENRYVAGTVAVFEGDTDVTANYRILEVRNGHLTVTPRPVTVASADLTVVYDGLSHASDTYTVHYTDAPSVEALPAGHELITSVIGTCRTVQIDPALPAGYASLPNTIDTAATRILCGERDVTANYTVTYAPGALTVLPRPITITAASTTRLYDGTPQSCPEGSCAWSEKPAGDLWDAVTLPADAPIAAGESLAVTYDGTYTDAGALVEGTYTAYENRIAAVTVTAADGTDVTANYRVTSVFGAITILPRPITVTSGDASWMYDGREKSHTAFSVGWSTADMDWTEGPYAVLTPPAPTEPCLVLDHQAEIVVTGRCLTVKRDADRAVLSYPNTVDPVASAIRTASGTDVSGNYRITYVEGALTVTPRPLTVLTESDAWVYNDRPAARTAATVDAASPHALPTAHYLVSENAPAFTDAGDYENIHTVRVEVSVDGKAVADVTDSFDITYRYGEIRIDRRPVTVYPGSAAKIYDDTPLTSSHYDYDRAAYGLVDRGILDGHSLTLRLEGAQTDAGVGENRYAPDSAEIRRADGTDVTDNYLISATVGTLEVKARPVTVTTESHTWLYDGEAHRWEQYAMAVSEIPWHLPEWSYVTRPTDLSTTILPGHTATLPFDRSVTDVVGYDAAQGYLSVANSVAASGMTVSTADGRDVTRNYAFTYQYGELTVLPRPVTVTSQDHTWIYDGDSHMWGGFDIGWGDMPVGAQWAGITLPTDTPALVARDRAHVTMIATVTEVMGGSLTDGYVSIPNTIDPSATAFTTDGRDISLNYLVLAYTEGELTVLPRPITVTSASQSWMYDALTHQCHKTDPDQWSPLPTGAQWTDVTLPDTAPLVAGHTLRIAFTGECTYVLWESGAIGSVPNTFDPFGEGYASSIRAADGRDVTHNYLITTVEGALTITPRPITVVCESGEKIYDGQSTAFDSCSVSPDSPYPLPDALPHFLDAVMAPVFVDAGTYQNRYNVTVRISDDIGSWDVTDCFEITYISGTVTIHRRPIALEIRDAEKIYDGQPLITDRADVLASYPGALLLVEGHFVTVVTDGSITEPGTVTAVYIPGSARIYDVRDRDMTTNYEILHVSAATLTVHKRPVTIQTSDAKKAYDGTPLTAPTTKVDPAGQSLVSGHIVELTITGSQTEVGTSPNTYLPGTLRILDADGRDVTHCYDATVREGMLEVTEKPTPDEEDPSTPDNKDPADQDDTETIVGYVKPAFSGTLYLRQDSAADYLGDARWWGTATPYGGVLSGGFGPMYLPSLFLEEQYDTTADMKFRDMLLDLLPYYLSTTPGSTVTEPSDVAPGNLGTAYTVTYATPPSALAWINEFRRLTEEQRRALLGEHYEEELAYREAVYDQYLRIGDDTLAYMQSVIDKQGFSLDDPGLISKVAYFIQHSADYNPQYDRALDESEDVAVAFLRDFDEGICVHYATSATMLFRALGIPARYTVGFMVKNAQADTWNEIISGGRNNQGHAWVEIYIDGLGWVMVEVTGADQSDDSEDPSDNLMMGSLTLEPVYLFKVYDGLPLIHTGLLRETDELKELLDNGYSYVATVSGMQTEIGKSPSVIESFTLYDPFGVDVTDRFALEFKDGELEVREGTLVDVYVYQNIKEYDALPLTYAPGSYFAFNLPAGVTLDLQVNISMTDVTELTLQMLNQHPEEYVTYTFYQNGEDVTALFSIRFVNIFRLYEPDDVVAAVTARFLELTANSKTAVYTEGAILQDAGWIVSKNPVLEGHAIDEANVIVLGTCDDPKVSMNNRIDESSVHIFDREGNDVTKNYEITLVAGLLSFSTGD